MRLQTLLIPIILTLTIGNCMFDAEPKSSEYLTHVYPELTLSVRGFTPGTKLWIRQFEDARVFSYGKSYLFQADFAGRFISTLVFENLNSKARAQIYADSNADGNITSADKGWLMSETTLHQAKQTEQADFTNFVSAVPLTVTGTWAVSSSYICFFAPLGYKPADFTNDIYLDRILLKTGKSVQDMGPILTFATTGTGAPTGVGSAALIPGTYSVECLLDSNKNGEYDSGETLSAAQNLTVTAPGPSGVQP